jgi:hypothetical protein
MWGKLENIWKAKEVKRTHSLYTCQASLEGKEHSSSDSPPGALHGRCITGANTEALSTY